MTAVSDSVVVSALEFDVLWESEGLPSRHVALDVPSPGMTHTERAKLVAQAWTTLEARGLAENARAVPELTDRLTLLAHPRVSIDGWVWADREIKALAVSAGSDAHLAVVDDGQVWLISARASALADAIVSIAGDMPAGPGRSVSVPIEVARAADAEAGRDPKALVTALESRGVTLTEAQVLASMLGGMSLRGQFCVERRNRNQRVTRADRVVAFHDTDDGRYLFLVRPSTDGRLWGTVTPADNRRIAACIRELLDEVE